MIKDIEKTVSYIIEMTTSKDGYAGLFKAGIVLVSSALIAFSQSAATLEGMDSEFFKSKFEYEARTGQVLAASNCVTPPQEKPACQYLKHQQEKLDAGVNLLNSWVNLATVSGMALLLVSLFGVIFHPHIHTKPRKDA